jgi:hypothetical protein
MVMVVVICIHLPVTHQMLTVIKGPFLTTKYFYPNLEKGKGKVANISAGFGSISSASGSMVCATDVDSDWVVQQTKELPF